jgi:5-methylcytosine-specific restriction endonuclease McrA
MLNTAEVYKMEIFTCLSCGKENEMKRNHFNKYCNNQCQNDHRLIAETLPKFESGALSNRRTLHRVLKYLHGYRCVVCGNPGEYNNKPLALQLDHIDGNAGNNIPENLRLLCPNCHSQTDTVLLKRDTLQR